MSQECFFCVLQPIGLFPFNNCCSLVLWIAKAAFDLKNVIRCYRDPQIIGCHNHLIQEERKMIM